MLSGLNPTACAVETLQYLKGTHPDFRAPQAVVAASLPNRLARAADVGLTATGNRLDTANPGSPQRLTPRERAERLTALRDMVHALVTEAESLQLPPALRGRFERYAIALNRETLTWITLDGPMAMLRGALADDYHTGPLDRGFLDGWQHLVEAHDALRPHLMPAPEEDLLPDPVPEATPEAADALTGEVLDVLKQGQDAGAVGQSVIDAMESMRDYFAAAKATQEAGARRSLVKTGLAAAGGIAALITGATSFAIDLTTIQTWAVTTGAPVVEALKPILARIVQMFGG